MILDPLRVQDITQNKAKLITALAQLFLSELPDMIEAIERSFKDDDRKALSDNVHRLKSALGNFANSGYYQEVGALERSALEQDSRQWQQDWLAAKEKLDTLIIELKQMAGL
jgi:HPt (histidine-containing phosphotransfer) domain-containing protein